MTPIRSAQSLSAAVNLNGASRVLIMGLALLVCAPLTGCQPAVLDPKGPIGHADRTILIDSLAIMLAIVVPTIFAAFGFAWWFRAANKKATYLPDWEFSGRIEMIVWAIPILTIILLGGVTWISAHQIDPAKPIESKEAALEIQVVAMDWKWLFIYPDQGVAAVNTLVVPAGRPLHFTITSASVLNTFFVPRLGSMIYAMNGMTTELYLRADEEGTYRGISGHFSGEGFSDMHFEVKSVSAEQFAAWINGTRAVEKALDSASYTELSKPTINLPLTVFGSVEKDIFSQVVSQQLAPGPGPELHRQGISAKPRIKS